MEYFEPFSRRRFLNTTFKLGAIGIAGFSKFASSMSYTSETAKSGTYQIGCYTHPWDKHDYRLALDAIAEAGFKYAGLMTTKSKNKLVISTETSLEEAQRIGEEAKKRSLSVLSVYGGDFGVGKSLKNGIAGIEKLIDNCAACKTKNLLVGGTGDEKLYDRYYQAISECCDYAAEKGVGITIKPHGGLNATGPQCRKIIEMVGHKNFSLWYDPGNIFYYSNGELDPVTDAATVDGLVTGMCVKDYLHPKNVLVTPGTGKVDFPAVLKRIQKGDFTKGPLVIECLKPGNLQQTLKEAKKARQFILEILQ